MEHGTKNLRDNKFKRVSSKDALLFDIFDKGLYALVILSIFIFVLWPMLAVIKESIFRDGTITLDLYKNLFGENKKILFNSLFIATIVTIISTVISYFIALYISFSKNKGKKIVLLTLLLTMISPPFVSSLAYITLFGRRGLITHKLLHLSINPYGWKGVVLMQCFGHISFATLILIGVMKTIDKNMVKASLDLGGNPLQTLFKVIIPLSKPGIIVSVLITFVKSLSDFGTPIIIGGDFTVLATEAYLNIAGSSNLSKAAAINVLLLIPALIAFVVYSFYMKNLQGFSYMSLKSPDSGEETLKFPKIFNSIIVFITWFFVIFMLVQYASIILSAFLNYSGNKYYFTLEYFKNFKYGKLKSVLRSVIYSFIAAVLGSLIGVLISYYIDRRNFVGNKLVDFISTLPYMLPGPFLGLGYILAFNDYPLALTGTASIVVLNCIFKQIPIATKAGSALMKNISIETENAAKDVGAHNIFVIKDIVFPMLKPAFAISAVNFFTATMTTVGAIIFLITPSAKVATVEMFNDIKSGNYGLGSVWATIIIIITLLVNITFSKMLLNNGEKESKKNVSRT
ncbi:ABC transporter permease [Haloimpatiens lingqiaonensis]|uniref:ABC transporter permease n=1 Tax=Haloimpatiens lingqiaonensis TaxID=1380675 RepID=UPI0010FD4689|nr:iron ABC transporter permease [Haloimpatiens lingqiaonensis]